MQRGLSAIGELLQLLVYIVHQLPFERMDDMIFATLELGNVVTNTSSCDIKEQPFKRLDDIW